MPPLLAANLHVARAKALGVFSTLQEKYIANSAWVSGEHILKRIA